MMSDKTWTAYCWADGTIKFTSKREPAGALPIARHASRRALRAAIEPCSRLAYDGKTMIVAEVRDIHIGWKPGDKVVALLAFCARVEAKLGKELAA
jgi:hypothetical protein